MKLTVEQNNLAQILTKVTSIVDRKNTFPILANVKLTAKDGKLHALATDMDIEVTSSCEANIDSDGETTASAATLLGIVKSLPKGSLVSLNLGENDRLHVESGKSKFQIETLPVMGFPVMASEEYDNVHTISAIELHQLFSRTAFAMSTEEARYYLNGVFIHNDDDGNLCGVATDGARLAIMTLDSKITTSKVIVPKKTVNQLTKLLIDGDIELSTSDGKVRFSGYEFTIVSKVVEGTFPDYKRVIPDGNDNIAVVSSKDISSAANRVTLVSNDRTRGVKMTISNGKCELSVAGSSGKAIDEVVIDYDGPDIEMGFNSKYIADAMAQAESGDVTLRFGDSGSPIIIEPNDYEGLRCVVMPMRLT